MKYDAWGTLYVMACIAGVASIVLLGCGIALALMT